MSHVLVMRNPLARVAIQLVRPQRGRVQHCSGQQHLVFNNRGSCVQLCVWHLVLRDSHAVPSTEALPYEGRIKDAAGNKEVDFTRPEVIYKTKRTSELVRGLLILQLSSSDRFVQSAMKLMSVSQKLLGKRLFEGIMRRTFFGQFAIEEHYEQIRSQKQRMEDCGIASMFAGTAEEDVGDNVGFFDEDRYVRNLDKMVKFCLQLTDEMCRVKRWPKLTQLKITSYMKADVLGKLSKVIEDQDGDFRCASSVSLDNFVRGLDGNMEVIPECTEEEMDHMRKALLRFNRIAQRASDLDIHLLVDAEKVNINPCMSLITMAMMKKFNKRKALVWNTYQCYLKETEANLTRHAQLADQEGFCFGVKLVRGAYMDAEIHNARESGCEVPIHPSYQATNATYDKMVEYLMRRCLGRAQHETRFIIASHNEESVLKAVALMKELGIPSSSGKIVFGQLYGMCDHVSYALGQAHYLTYKSVVIGPIEDVLLYLMRRAQENNTVFHRLQKEKGLLKQEIFRRLSPGSWREVKPI